MRYTTRTQKRAWPKRLIIITAVGLALLIGSTFAVRHVYFAGLEPVSAPSQKSQLITIEKGASVEEIAKQLKDARLIRSAWAFKLYVGSKEVRDALQAGTYRLTASQSVPEIVAQLTHGKVATNLVTVLPGQRIDQVRDSLKNYGFQDGDIAKAFDATTYAGHPALVDKPAGAGLEGYLYPESYQKDSGTTAAQIIEKSLNEMHKALSPELRAALAAQGLSIYEGIIVASIVEQEAANPADRAQVAQVYLKRLRVGMKLQADPTAEYGAALAGHINAPLSYDSPYNTYLYPGLPPTPISNVGIGSLQAVAKPANTDWLYFVAGDDGTTHFTKTLPEHEAATRQYCTKLCAGQ
ncbi:MAG TPA: endolytic transglycosylase MltG [Candidatus Saccharimonadales bacterium]|nr:endolytic transglycosylase MltG [Candidatus Saccharimonadales bacterium]